MIRFRFACAVGAFLASAALSAPPAFADSLQDCKKSDNPDFAIEACTKYLVTASGDQVVQGTFLRAIAYFGKHDYYHAIEDFNVVINIRPVSDAYVDRGLAYQAQIADDPAFADKAISDLIAAANLPPGVDDNTRTKFWFAYLIRASENVKKGEDALVLTDESIAIRLNPDKATAIKADLAQAYKQRAWQNIAGGQYDRAVSDLQQTIQLDPTTADKLNSYLAEAKSRQPGPYSAIVRGDQHEQDQNYEQALIDYTEAIQSNPNFADAHLNRGYAYRALDRFEDARTDFDEAIRLDPKNWFGHYARAQLYQFMDQFENAVADLDQASAIIEQAHDLEYENEKARIDDARKSLKFSSTIQNRWISYLKEIQVANTHPNWQGAPYDLYVKQHSLQNSPNPVQPPTAPRITPSSEPSPSGRGRHLSMLRLLGLLAILGIGLGAISFYRRQNAR